MVAGKKLLQLDWTPSSKQYFKRAIKKFGKRYIDQQIHRILNKHGKRVVRHIKNNKLSGQVLRSTVLRASLEHRVVKKPGAPTLRIGVFRLPARKYAGVMEEGTRGLNPLSRFPTIKPKRAKALAIPTREGLGKTPTGKNRYKTPWDYPRELVFIPFRNDGITVGGFFHKSDVDKAPRKRRLRDLTMAYLLVRSLDLPPHYFLRAGWAEMLPLLKEDIRQLMIHLLAKDPPRKK